MHGYERGQSGDGHRPLHVKTIHRQVSFTFFEHMRRILPLVAATYKRFVLKMPSTPLMPAGAGAPFRQADAPKREPHPLLRSYDASSAAFGKIFKEP
jgi:hypothetical protein